jgi:(+)-trans-carveol dehydrogenase
MLLRNPPIQELMTGDPSAGRDDLAPALSGMHVISIPWVEAEDVSNLVVWLASDESRYVTGTTQVLDAGALAPFKISR